MGLPNPGFKFGIHKHKFKIEIIVTDVVMDDFKISKLDRFRFDFLKKI